MKKSHRTCALLYAVLSCLFLSTTANAALINGTIELAGAWTPVDSVPSPVTIDTATGIDFTNDQAAVMASSGDMALPFLTLATMNDFQFNPLAPNPVTVWSVGGFSFSMDNVTIDTQTASALTLSGSGMITGGGFDPTPGTWAFSGQTASNITFSWSSSNLAVPIPPAVWLFGSGLLGLVGIARRRKAS